MRPAWDTPYGRMAILADDQGAAFAIMAMAQAASQ
jgi:predicted enzyme related to lactoylglutathione lyase